MAKEHKPVAWRSLGVRWDHVEHFLIKYDDGEIEDYHQHISFHTPYGYLKDVPMDPTLTRWSKP